MEQSVLKDQWTYPSSVFIQSIFTTPPLMIAKRYAVSWGICSPQPSHSNSRICACGHRGEHQLYCTATRTSCSAQPQGETREDSRAMEIFKFPLLNTSMHTRSTLPDQRERRTEHRNACLLSIVSIPYLKGFRTGARIKSGA